MGISVLVVSCDSYADLWEPFFTLFRRFWPDCPFEVYLVANHKQPRIPGVEVISVGDDLSWSDNLGRVLRSLRHEYVLLFLDDLMLTGPVATADLASVLQWAAAAKPNYVRLNPTERPPLRSNTLVGEVPPGALYRTSTVLSLWRRGVLESLLKPGESAWDFELLGSVRSDAIPGFYATWRAHFSVVNCVIKGKWDPHAVRALRQLGVDPDLRARGAMNRIETVSFRIAQARSTIFRAFPWRYRRKLRAWLRG